MSLTTDSLVSTKLRPSQARPQLVARPQLTAKLEREPSRKLTLISAPAGFGKTTLLVEWLKDRTAGGWLGAWLSLDEGDNDPVCFLSYLVAALGRVEEGIGEGVLAALPSLQPPRIEVLVGALINEVAALQEDFVLVLDDYHAIENRAVHEAVAFLLDHLPPNMHFIIASRIDPPLPIARLRARGQMAELGAADLSFTPEETAVFLKEVMGLDLSADDVAVLEERTEGWIAGLQLAALSMRDRKDISGFIESFSGSQRDILDFLAEEVLERQTERTRSFLLETSILSRLTASLCEAVTGRSDAQEILEGLEKENLFVVALDDERRWYRYHHLFADFLRSRLRREQRARTRELHRRAAAWYERSSLTSEAVGHALEAEDHRRAVDLVELAARETRNRGEILTLLGWLEALPEEAKRYRPRLLLEHATALMAVGRLEGIEHLVRQAECAIESGEGSIEGITHDKESIRSQFLSGYVAAIRAWRDHLLGDSARAIELAGRALELLPENDLRPRSFAYFTLAAAYRDTDDLAAASAAFTKASELSRVDSNTYTALRAMARHAEVQMARGRLRKADDILRRALRLTAKRDGALLPATGEVYVAMGELLYERDDLDSAGDRLMEGLELAERTGQFDTLVEGHVALSQVRRARGDVDGAFKLAEEAERLARRSGLGQVIVEAAAQKARLCLARGDLAGAAFEQERAAGVSWVPPFAREKERVTQARLLSARHEYEKELRLLERLREAAEMAGRMGSIIEILAMQALALWAGNEKERAVRTVMRALALAEPEGYVRTFLDEGPPMTKLLSELLEVHQRGRSDSVGRVPAHYLRKLLAALERDATGTARPATELPEALSERELEVLQLVAAGKSNRRIATELFVSVGTVKTHINHLYRKLDAHSRTQALARATELKLL